MQRVNLVRRGIVEGCLFDAFLRAILAFDGDRENDAQRLNHEKSPPERSKPEHHLRIARVWRLSKTACFHSQRAVARKKYTPLFLLAASLQKIKTCFRTPSASLGSNRNKLQGRHVILTAADFVGRCLHACTDVWRKKIQQIKDYQYLCRTCFAATPNRTSTRNTT